MKKLILAAATIVVFSFAANPVFAACADDLKKVKANVAKLPDSKKSNKESANMKIKEAEAAIAKKDEAGCMTAVKAADAIAK